jgi:hypothetical protein
MAGFITMATTTPNYGWPVPTSTDFVKDGATAIEALGDAIDATVFALPSGALTLLNATTFSASSAVNISNVFSNTYPTYRILISLLASAGNQTLSFRCRENVTDKTSADYFAGTFTVNYLGTTAAIANNGGTAFYVTTNLGTADPSIATIDLYRTASKCAFSSTGINPQSLAANFQAGSQVNMSNFTGFSIFPTNTGTITGSVRVYGYQGI